MGSGRRGPPPAWAEGLLEAAVPIGVVGESIRGDLETEYLELRGPDWIADLWYTFEVIKISLHYSKGMGMSDFMQDVRFGFRMLKRMPMVTIVAALSLAAGIAASTTMFATMYGFLYAPLPYADQGDLQTLLQIDRATGDKRNISIGNVLDLAERVDAFENVAAWRTVRSTLTGGDEPVRVLSLDATPNVFRVLGREAALGRTFGTDEGRPGSAGVAVMTHYMWETMFATDPGVVGRPVEVAGREYTVIGVMPPDFEFLTGDIGLVMANTFEDERDTREGSSVLAVTQLAAGATAEQAQEQAEAAWQSMTAQYPDQLTRFTFRLETLREQFPGESDTRLVQVMLLVALFVLIIAAANVANLLLARAEERAHEMAVRVSLGAGRIRLARQLLTESTLLGLLGGALGVVLAIFAVNQLAAALPVGIPRTFGPQIHPVVLLFTVGISMGVGVFFGLAPALQALRSNQRETLSSVSRGGTVGRARSRVRTAFVIGEIAVALALLAGAGAMSSMARNLVDVDLGLRSEGLLTFRTIASGERYSEPVALAAFHRQVEEQLLGLPQVSGVAVMDELPRGRNLRAPDFTIDGREPQEGHRLPETMMLSVNRGYFATMEVPLLEGRLFESFDREGSGPVVVVSRTFADFHFPGESVVGRRITLDDESREIVGVVGDVLHTRVELPGGLAGMAYLPLEQHPIRSVAYAARTTGNPTDIAGALRPAVWAVEASAPVDDVRTLDDFIAGEMAIIRVLGGIMGLFGLLALGLAAMGIYGVMAHAVTQRNREIGIRMALGAQSGSVVKLVLRNGVIQAGAGIVLGLPLALLIRRAALGIGAQFKVELGGPGSIAAIAAVLAAVCLLSSYLPARRAAGVDPFTALRREV